MLPEGSHVLAVYLDPMTGLCAAEISNKLFVDCSTIETAVCLQVKNYIAGKIPSANFYDAPVSGGPAGAAKGNLAFFLGCSKEDPYLPRLEQLLGMMGNKIIPCGGPSLGLAAKLAHNYLGGTIMIACAEAMDMGIRSGLDARVLASVITAGAAQNMIADRFNPVPGVHPDAPSTNDYKPGFKVQLAHKDYKLAIDMAKRVGTTLALGDAGLKTYDGASNDPRCKDLDSSVVFRYLNGKEDWAGR
jgi:3-hydroxyisobutyrate dehydrogenase